MCSTASGLASPTRYAKGISQTQPPPSLPVGQRPLPDFMYYGSIAAFTTVAGIDEGSRLSLPASVTIPAGRLSAPLPITILNDTELDGPETVSITASADGFNNGVDTITVHEQRDGDVDGQSADHRRRVGRLHDWHDHLQRCSAG